MNARRTTIALAATILLLSCAGAKGENSRVIYNASELIAFAKDVNNKNNHSGTTVFLANDITFDSSSSGDFNPIGNSGANRFCGVFDGQGYTIKGINYTKSIQYSGLFGNARGATIKNLVIGESCVFNNTMTISSNVNFGGVVGMCQGTDKPCVVENVVNMGRVIRSGPATS